MSADNPGLLQFSICDPEEYYVISLLTRMRTAFLNDDNEGYHKALTEFLYIHRLVAAQQGIVLSKTPPPPPTNPS